MTIESGDIYLYNNRGRGWGSYARPIGTALVVIGVQSDDDGDGEPVWVSARDAFNLTTYRVFPDQLDPVPADRTVAEALRDILDTLLGEEKSAKIMRDRLQTYESLVRADRIPPIDEERVVRAAESAPVHRS